MILATLLLAQTAPAQTAPAPEVVEGEDIVVRATFGRTTMLFDKGADGKLHNCRIMVSSGNQKRDTDACQATPVCYAKTADVVTDCVDFTAIDSAVAMPDIRPPAAKSQTFVLPPSALQPRQGLSAGQSGPLALGADSRETERQRVKPLPPPPTAPKSDPAVRITTGNGNAQDQ